MKNLQPVNVCYLRMRETSPRLFFRALRHRGQHVIFSWPRHLNSHGFDALVDLGWHSLKELIDRCGLASLTHPDDAAGVVVEHHRHVVVPFLDCDFADVQPFEALVGRLAELGFEGRLVDGLDRLGVEVEVPGHRFHAQTGLAELGRVDCQTAGDAGVDIDELQALDAHFVALTASNLSVLDLQQHGETAEAQIPNEFRVWVWIAPGAPQT